jgi:hypothetical protein
VTPVLGSDNCGLKVIVSNTPPVDLTDSAEQLLPIDSFITQKSSFTGVVWHLFMVTNQQEELCLCHGNIYLSVDVHAS